ncbi:MAG: TolC family outer membrane protein [Ramlibacter sp.]|jgi:outer membrane protein|nr:TolC family outer membrane protein [Ramlibacter sp.]
MKRARALSIALLAAATAPAWSLDLVEAWRAAAAHDPEFAAARAAREAGDTRRAEARALWRPTVNLEAGAGIATQESATRGASFSAPGFGSSTGVNFDTSVTRGTSLRYGVVLRQPLYNRGRLAEGRQLELAGDAGDAAFSAAEQELMLRSTQRYFEAAVAKEQLRLLERQETAVERARIEAQDRFRIGDRPVTDVHEATARAAALRAQRLAAASEHEIRQAQLADLTGLPPGSVLATPRSGLAGAPLAPMDDWLQRAARDNPQVRLAELEVRKAEQEAAKTASAVSPSVDLVAQLGRDRLSGSGDFGQASNTSTQRAVGVQLTVPLYTGGWRTARQAGSAALLRKAQAELDRARQQAMQQARAAWLDISVGQDRTAALEAGLLASRARLDATEVGLQAGDRTTLDLLNAQNDAAAIELALLQSRVTLLTQRLRLAALAGALDEAALEGANRELAASAAGPSPR